MNNTYSRKTWFILVILFGIAAIIRLFSNTYFVQASKYYIKQITPSPNSYPYPASEEGDQENYGSLSYPPPVIEEKANLYSEDFSYPAPPINSDPIDTSTLIYKIRLPLIARPYDRANAANYANYWAHDRNPIFPNYGTYLGCNDCTNYLSQMLMAGGHTQLIVHGDTAFDWWYYCDDFSVCSNSKTWSATDWMNIYATNNGNRFAIPSGWVDTLSEGDFFLLDLPTSPQHGIPNHARLVVGWGYPEEGDNFNMWSLLVNQHCTDRKKVRWDYNLPDGTLIWLWHAK